MPPSSEYSTPSRGGLKLKGAKPEGVTKKKKKKDRAKGLDSKEDVRPAEREGDGEKGEGKGEGGQELSEEELRTLEDGDTGDKKTAAERAQEEMRRRRVCFLSYASFSSPLFLVCVLGW